MGPLSSASAEVSSLSSMSFPAETLGRTSARIDVVALETVAAACQNTHGLVSFGDVETTIAILQQAKRGLHEQLMANQKNVFILKLRTLISLLRIARSKELLERSEERVEQPRSDYHETWQATKKASENIKQLCAAYRVSTIEMQKWTRRNNTAIKEYGKIIRRRRKLRGEEEKSTPIWRRIEAESSESRRILQKIKAVEEKILLFMDSSPIHFRHKRGFSLFLR